MPAGLLGEVQEGKVTPNALLSQMPQHLLSFQSLDSDPSIWPWTWPLGLCLGGALGKLSAPWIGPQSPSPSKHLESCGQPLATRGSSQGGEHPVPPQELLLGLPPHVRESQPDIRVHPRERWGQPAACTEPRPQTRGPGKEAPFASTRQELIPGVACQDARAGRIPMKVNELLFSSIMLVFHHHPLHHHHQQHHCRSRVRTPSETSLYSWLSPDRLWDPAGAPMSSVLFSSPRAVFIIVGPLVQNKNVGLLVQKPEEKRHSIY